MCVNILSLIQLLFWTPLQFGPAEQPITGSGLLPVITLHKTGVEITVNSDTIFKILHLQFYKIYRVM